MLFYLDSKVCTTLVTLGGKNTKVMLLNFDVWQTTRLTNFGSANNMWRCIIQNHNHLLILAFEVIVELQNPSCFIWVPPNILLRLPPSKTLWLLGCVNHKPFNLSVPVELTTRASFTCSFCNFRPFTFPCANVLLWCALKYNPVWSML